MTAPNVSVVIPTHNRSAYFRQAVASVLAQTYTTFEVVVSDNGSTDDTAAVVGEFRDDRIRYFRHGRNIGMVPNWNAGIRRAQAAYVAVLEDDNWWRPDYLERVVAMLDVHPEIALVHTAAFLADRDGAVMRVQRRWNEDRISDAESELRDLIQGNRILLSTVTMRRRCLETLGLFDEAIPYAADWEMWLRVCVQYPIGYLAEPLVFYRQHEASGTAQIHMRPFQLFHDHRQVIDKGLHHARAVHGPERTRQLRRLSYRWLLRLQAQRAWHFYRAGELDVARREAVLALNCVPGAGFRVPATFPAVLLATLLPASAQPAVVAFWRRVAQPVRGYIRSALGAFR